MSKAPFPDEKIEVLSEENKKEDDEEKFLRESFDLAQDIAVKWIPSTVQKIEKKSTKKKKF